MNEAFELSRWAIEVRAVEHAQILAGHELGPARWAVSGRDIRLRRILRITAVGHGPDHLRNDIPGPFHLDDVSFAQILPRHEIEVVQRRHLHGRPADLYRFEDRKRIHRTSPSHVDADRLQLRLGDVGREFARDRVTWLAPADDAELGPQLELIDLHNAAVDGEVEIGADPVLDLRCPRVSLSDRDAPLPIRRGGNSPAIEQVEQLGLAGDERRVFARLDYRIAKKAERLSGSDGRIELPKST